MKKIIGISTIVLLVVVAVWFVVKPAKVVEDEMPTPQDYAVLHESIGESAVITTGKNGDFLVKIKATPELISIANKEKTARFLSTENPKQYIEEGYVLINVIPFNTMEKLGWTNHSCSYRLFYGTAEDMNYDGMYAVELCAE